MDPDRIDRLLAEVAATLRSVADEIAGVAPSAVVGILGRVGEVRRAADAVGALAAGRVVDSDRGPATGTESDESIPRRMGERDAATLVAQVAGIPATEARAWCTVGERILPEISLLGATLPSGFVATADAIRDGAVSIGAALRVTDAVHLAGRWLDLDGRQGLERELLGHARHLSERQLTSLCRSVPDVLAPDDAEWREERLRARAGLTIGRGGDGLVKWVALLDPESAGFLTAALDARTAPRRAPSFAADAGEDADAAVAHPSSGHSSPAHDDGYPEPDPRSPARRRLDALVAIARDSLAHDPGQVAGASVSVVVTMDLDQLRSGIGVARIDGVDEPVSARTARRLAADARVIPVVLGGGSLPVDLGRGARLFSEAQRRAIAVRDGGCAWPSCTAPPGWCEIGHVTAWARGGGTDLENAIMLCPFHHRRFDLDGWGLIRRGGIPWFVPPSSIDVRRTPRRGGRVPVVEVPTAQVPTARAPAGTA